MYLECHAYPMSDLDVGINVYNQVVNDGRTVVSVTGWQSISVSSLFQVHPLTP